MKTVVDASVVLDLLLGEGNKVAEEFWSREASGLELLAPKILGYEVMNGLRSAVLQRRMSLAEAVNGWKRFGKLDIGMVDMEDGEVIVEFACRNNRSVYDSSYAVLARKMNVELVTLDRKLKELV